MSFYRFLTWPPLAATILATLVQPLLNGRYHLLPTSVSIAMAVGGYLFSFGAAAANASRHPTIERICSLIVAVLLSILTVNAIVRLGELLIYSQVKAAPLLQSAIALWLSNIFTFSLWYWYMDGHDWRGRLRESTDFLFPQPVNLPEGTRAPLNYFDYLFLAFNTATAFSPTDVVPVTTRTRLLMMCQSAVSLGTVAIVAARAVNIAP
jgi:uncharacterized membrane protein